MDSSASSGDSFYFGQFEVRADSGRLLKHGKQVYLQDQPFRLLVALLQRHGSVVSRRDLRDHLWPSGTLVEFDKSLDVAMAKLRRALGDDSSSPRFIETVPKRGYQFIAPLSRPVGDGLPASEVSPGTLPESVRSERLLVGKPIYTSPALIAVVTAVLVGGAWYWHAHRDSGLPERAAVLVGDFSNSTGDASFDRSLRTAATIDLAQSPYLTVVSDERIEESLQLLGRPSDDRLEPAIARQVCQLEHAASAVNGSLQKADVGFLLSVSASRCSDGSILTTLGYPIPDKAHVLFILKKALGELRRKFGESAESLQHYDVTVVQATTNSLEALKAYQLGMDLRSHTRNIDAIAAFKTSIALDSTFAIAYAQLGSCYANLEETQLATQYFQKAFELREHATEPERLYIAGRYFDIVTGEMEMGASVYKLWTQIYPNDWRGYNAMSNDANLLGRYKLAAQAAERAIELEPNHAYGYTNRAVALLGLNRFNEAQQVSREAMRRGRDGGVIHSVLFLVALINGDELGLERERSWAAKHPEEVDTPDAEAQLAEAQGRMRESTRLFAQLADRAVRLGLPGYAQIALAQEAFFDCEAGQRSAALDHIRSAEALGDAELALELSALVYARSGNVAKSRALLAEINRRFPLSTFNISVFGPTIRMAMTLAGSGKISAAEVTATLRPAEAYEMGRQAVLTPTYIRGVAFLSAHAATEAEREFRKIIENRGVDASSPVYPLAALGLARALVMQGRPKDGGKVYESLLHQLRAADTDFPVLLQAKREYNGLQRASSDPGPRPGDAVQQPPKA